VRIDADAVAVQRTRFRSFVAWTTVVLATATWGCPFVWALLVWGAMRAHRALLSAAWGLRDEPAGTVELDGERVVVRSGGAETELRVADVVSGWIEPDGERWIAILTLTEGRRVIARFADGAVAAELLDAAGVSTDQRVLRVPLGTDAAMYGQGPVYHLLGPWLLAVVTMPFAFLSIVGITALSSKVVALALLPLVFLVMLAVGALGIASYLVPREAVVGVDGVRVGRFGRGRFVRYDDIADVSVAPWGVVLSLRSGEELRLPTKTFLGEDLAARDALAVRIEDGLDGHRAWAPDEQTKHALLERRGRDLARWRADLDRGRSAEAGYRSVAFAPDELAGVVADPKAPTERRIGAALALASAEETEAREAARVAARATANPRVRVALERAVDGDLAEKELEEALSDEELRARN
jgi:hypothetical protein